MPTTNELRAQITRTQSAPMYKHGRALSHSQDVSFLGPTLDQNFTIHADTASKAEEVSALQVQLTSAMQALEASRLEVKELRQILARPSVSLQPNTDRVFEDIESAGDRTCKDGSSMMCHPSSSVNTTGDDLDTLSNYRLSEQDDLGTVFPRFDDLRRNASPLPPPDEPGAASAFLRGQLLATKPSSSVPPDSTIVPEPRYDHLTFFVSVPQI